MPADGRAGSGEITITVSDGTLATSQSFTATVAVVRPSAPTGLVSVSIGTSAPAPPVLLPVTVTPGSAAFTWVPRGAIADRYQVQIAPGAGLAPTISLSSTGAGSSLTWLAPQGTWAGRVIARNACGTSAPSNEVRFVQP
jgi:hypothetical protein